MPAVRYNERSWAIDVITEINVWAQSRSLILKRAGGESGLSSQAATYFPDVLLFADSASSRILQGWELKFPDTSINDPQFVENAKTKAQILGLRSFLLWNVSTAVLYKITTGEGLEIIKTWDMPGQTVVRSQVKSAREKWIEMLHKILDCLVGFFNEGVINGVPLVDSLTGEAVANLVLQNVDLVSVELKKKAQSDSGFSDSVILWWRAERTGHPEDQQPWDVLSRNVIFAWFNKLLFAHILKSYYGAAGEVESINSGKGVQESLKIFKRISEKCDFLNVFGPQLGEECIPKPVWEVLCELNRVLCAAQLQDIDQALLHELLEKSVNKEKRKVSGLFVTPLWLSDLLVNLTIENKTLNVLDPCCGTGTIARAVYDMKREAGLDRRQALFTVWASDKFEFPIHLTTLALLEPGNYGEIIHAFQSDATNLKDGMQVVFRSPIDGSFVKQALPSIDYVVSNLPFVKQEDLELLNPGIGETINDRLKELTGDGTLDSRSDLYAYLVFYLWEILEPKGQIGVIVSNSWLSTEWGKTFEALLNRFFHVRFIITSGKGRWFDNAKVVTTLIVLKKKPEREVRSPPADQDEKTVFVTLEKPLKLLSESGQISELTALIRSGVESESDLMKKEVYSRYEIRGFLDRGLGLNALFADCRWINGISVKLIKTSELFAINRGERRGWDKMFFPSADQTQRIEKDYIVPVLKSSSSIRALTIRPDGLAFCCTRKIDELKRLGHKGALEWVKQFERAKNEKGKPLKTVLKRPGLEWYGMRPDTVADLVTSINPGDRLFFAKLTKRGFVNQRLVRFTRKNDSTDIDLCHALMNSAIGLFYLEALGFGRGEGALDLNATKLRKNSFMLNPNLLTQRQKTRILTKFSPLQKRDILPLYEELKRSDRLAFEATVLEEFGILGYKDQIINALKGLYEIRSCVKCDT
ncbi:MAG: N-6 DNA methylase [Candidatus Altiarchaeia archaeon]